MFPDGTLADDSNPDTLPKGPCWALEPKGPCRALGSLSVVVLDLLGGLPLIGGLPVVLAGFLVVLDWTVVSATI